MSVVLMALGSHIDEHAPRLMYDGIAAHAIYISARRRCAPHPSRGCSRE